MRPLYLLSTVVAASFFLGNTFPVEQGATRTIRYDRSKSIAERLLPSDTTVLVAKAPTTPFVGVPELKESLKEEVARLSTYSTIAVVRVTDISGGLTDGGAWIETTVRGQVTQVIKSGPLVDASGTVELRHDGGSLSIDSVIVRAGTYPEFVLQQNYLLFLGIDRARNSTYAGHMFRVNTEGRVEKMPRTDGSSVVTVSNLIGRTASEITNVFNQLQ